MQLGVRPACSGRCRALRPRSADELARACAQTRPRRQPGQDAEARAASRVVSPVPTPRRLRHHLGAGSVGGTKVLVMSARLDVVEVVAARRAHRRTMLGTKAARWRSRRRETSDDSNARIASRQASSEAGRMCPVSTIRARSLPAGCERVLSVAPDAPHGRAAGVPSGRPASDVAPASATTQQRTSRLPPTWRPPSNNRSHRDRAQSGRRGAARSGLTASKLVCLIDGR
jgi:hypothetical protein